MMRDYVIVTDSSCDMPAQLAQDLELVVLPLTVLLEGREYKNYLDEREITFADFYAALRSGASATTSAVNTDAFLTELRKIADTGKDVLYLGFSTGLSNTYNAGAMACAELAHDYPHLQFLHVDTLCASLGQGLLVYLAVQQKRLGKSIEEVRDFAEQMKLHICHWFTVDDLHHLKRGGRVSATTAVLGSMLQIKPILHVDNEGHLINMDKVRGRRASLEALFQRMQNSAINPRDQVVFISHGDCIDDARYLGEMIKKKLKVEEVIYNHVGPVIGAHAGPGVVALFFIGKER